MLQNLIFLTLCVVAIKGTGEFTVLSAPDSLLFEGTIPLQSQDIGEVVYVSLGNPVSGHSQWPGLIISNPYNLAKGVIVVSLDGTEHSKVSAAGKTYSIEGNSVDQTLNDVGDKLKAVNETFCFLCYKQLGEEKFSLKNIIADVEIPPVPNTKYLNGNFHFDDATYLETISSVNAVTANLDNMKKLCNFIYVSISIDGVVKAHGENSEAVNEALDLFSTAVKRLNSAAQKSYNNEALVIVVVNKDDGSNRIKRDIAPKDSQNLYNLAEYYNEDYPVIFNIILWFMVVFGFALLAICYAIGSMDPGRDSIIYRMTSTRMKKDN